LSLIHGNSILELQPKVILLDFSYGSFVLQSVTKSVTATGCVDKGIREVRNSNTTFTY